MPRLFVSLNFSLILLALLSGDVFSADPELPHAPGDRQPCSFNEDRRTYDATDLLLCLNNLAVSVLKQHYNPKKMTDRIDSEARLLPAFAPDFSSNYFDDDAITSFLSGLLPSGLQNLQNGLLPNGLQSLQNGLMPGGLQNLQTGLFSNGLQNLQNVQLPITQLPSLSNLLNFNGLTRPNFNLFTALSSIAQNDDLQCVPRILCEMASGSSPNSLSYRQNPGNSIINFGQNGLIGLLTAFDTSGTSPLINFGKAALLGYANRGHSSMCYQAYSKCPSNPDQLISYLNNHNGGFFQFFNGKPGNYYRPQQHYPQQYQQNYYKNSESRIVGGSKKEYPSAEPALFGGPEADRTGTGKLSFSNSEYYSKDKENDNLFLSESKDTEAGNFKFPKDRPDNNQQLGHQVKTQNIFSDLNTNDLRKDRYRKDRKFFPQENDYQRFRQEDFNLDTSYNRKPRYETSEKRESYVHFPHETVQKDTSTFSFPNNLRVF